MAKRLTLWQFSPTMNVWTACDTVTPATAETVRQLWISTCARPTPAIYFQIAPQNPYTRPSVIGAHITWQGEDRSYLAEVTGETLDAEYRHMLHSRYMNGEPAPDVDLCLVQVLDRTEATR